MRSNFKKRIIGLKIMTFRPGWRLAILAILFLCLSFLKNSQAYPYLAPENYYVLDDPRQAVVADFDGDGLQDMAAVNYRANKVSILINSGDGTFEPAVNVSSVGSGPNSITSGDLDLDLDIDLAITNYISDTIVILRNDGSGVFTFTPGDSYTTGAGLRGLTGIVATQLDANPSLDLAVANNYDNTLPSGSADSVSVLLNNGAGTFAAAVDYAVSDGPLQIVSADFSGDAINDLAVSGFMDSAGQGFGILKNNGDGTFGAAVNYSGPGYITAGDFDNDTVIELAGVVSSASIGSGFIYIYENDGLGAFTLNSTYSTGKGGSSIVAGNFNNAAGIDLAVSNYFDDTISIYLGNNDLTFTAGANINTLPGPIFLQTADFDNDNKSDLASLNKFENIEVLPSSNSYSGNSISVYRSGVIITPTSGNNFVREGGSADSYSVVLASAPTADVKVTFSYDDSATGIDLTDSLLNPILSGGFITFTTLNWNTPQIITITAPIDATAEGQLNSIITHAITSVGDGDYDGSLAPDMKVIVADNDQAGVTIDQSGGTTPGRTEVKEGVSNDDSFSVVLEKQPTADVLINISHSSQISLSSTALTFTSVNWATPQNVTITAPNDQIIEGTKQEDIIFSASSADLAYNAFIIPSISVNIVDLNIIINNQICQGSMGDLNYDLQVDPTDRQAMVEMQRGEREFSYCADFNFDGYMGPPDLSAVDGYFPSNFKPVRNYQILLYETPATAPSTDVAEVGAPLSDKYYIYLREQPSDDVIIDVLPDSQVTVDADSVTPGKQNQLTFTPGNYFAEKEIKVYAVDNYYVDNPHTGTITHSAISLDTNYNAIVIPGVTVNIASEDIVGVLTTGGPFSVNEDIADGPISDTVGYELTFDPGAGVTVNLALSTPDGQTTLSTNSLDFTSANWNVPQLVTITAVNDSIYESDPHLSQVWGDMTSSDFSYTGTGSIDVSISDNDPMPTISINDRSKLESDLGTTMNFTVTLSAVSSLTTYVTYETADNTATVSDSDYINIPETFLIFNPGETSKTITANILGDNNAEPDEAFYVNLSNPLNATILDNQAVGTIVDDDTTATVFGGPGFNVMPATNLSCQPISNSSLNWTFNDNSTNEIGFRLYGVLFPNAYLIKEVATDATHLCNYAGGAAASCRLINETGLTTNTEYIRKVSAYIAAEESFTGLVSCYTLANIPKQVIITPLSTGVLNLKLDPNDGNPANTEYAIKEITTGQYLQPDGNFGNTESWQTYEQWGGANGIAMTGTPVPAVQIALTSSDPYNLAAKARNGDGVETDLGVGNGQIIPAATQPNIIATKGVYATVAKNWGINLLNTAFASIDLNNNQSSVLKGLSWLLNIALLILGIFFIIGIVSTVKHLRKDYSLSMALAIIDSLIFKKPQHIYEEHAAQNNNGVYSQVSYAKHKKMHNISKASLRGILAVGVLKALVLFAMMGGLIGLNHFSSAQTAPYTTGGQVSVGDILNYRIDLTNNGTAAATGIIVTDVLNSHLTYVSGSSKVNNATVANTGNNLTFNVGALGINESANITFKAKVNTGSEGQTITNQANVSGSNIANLPSSTTTNNVSAKVIPTNENTNKDINEPPVEPQVPACGNSIVETGEQCDNSACSQGNECLNCQCQSVITGQPVCGNTKIETGEQCDNSSCGTGLNCISCICQEIFAMEPVCGNGLIETGEGCDITGCGQGLTCRADCTCQPEEELPANTNQITGEEPLVGPGIITSKTPLIGPLLTELRKIGLIKKISELFFDNPVVEEVSQNVITPIILAIALINSLLAVILLSSYLLPFLHLLFVEPFLWLFRKKRKQYGVVYNSLTKIPLDLALVRLYSKKDNRLMQTKVTDKDGRYIMIASEPGEYYLAVTKPGYIYPTRYLVADVQDTKYTDLYHGESINVTEKDAVITANIPVDPSEKVVLPAKEIIRNYAIKNLRVAVSYIGIILALIIVLIYPTIITILALGAHIVLFMIFRRLMIPAKPKSWGIVYDVASKKPLGLTVVRIFDTKFNKLLETQVTDSNGRYSFLVGKNEYQLLTEKEGYQNKEIRPIDLVNNEEVVNLDVALQKK